MPRQLPAILALVVVNLLLCVSAAAETARPVEAVHPDELVSVQRGSIPVVISIPHGGRADIAGAEERTLGIRSRDVATDEVGLLVVQELTAELGGKPYYVMAQFSRRYADANRGPGLREEEAYESAAARAHYEAYHRALREYVDEVRERFGGGILIDIHGQSRRPGQIVRGTVRGQTVTAMLERHGLEALIGPDSIFGQLHEMGYEVEPQVSDPENSPADEEIYIGGYIVRAYGSHSDNGIDSIQVEIGRDHRREDVRRQTAEDLAKAIAVYVRAYLMNADLAEGDAEAENAGRTAPTRAE
jgi:N-formylglutamate amidohydrolase